MLKTLKKILPLLVFIAVMVLVQNWWRIELAIDPIEHPQLTASDTILYSTSWCPYCIKVKHFLKKANIPFTEYDIEKSARAYEQYERLSGRGVPVLKIGNNHVIEGYNREAIRKAIKTLH